MKTTVVTEGKTFGSGQFSVEIPSTEINNIGLMDDRRNHLMLAGVLVVAGVLLVGFGTLSGSQSSDTGTRKCPYCAEQIKEEAVKCRHCNSAVGPTTLNAVAPIAVNVEEPPQRPTQSYIKPLPPMPNTLLTRERVVAGAVVVAVLGVIAVVGSTQFFKSSSKEAKTALTNGVKASLAAAVALNRSAVLVGNGSGRSIKNCADVLLLEDTYMPPGYTVPGKAIAPSEEATCMFLGPDGVSGTFTAYGDVGKEAQVTRSNSTDCYGTGENSARVYLASFGQMASKDILPSQIMESACSKISNGSSSCKSECVEGFKSAARDAFK